MVDLDKYKGLSRTMLGLSCFLLTSCGINETEYESRLAADAPSGYGRLVNKESSLAEVAGDPVAPNSTIVPPTASTMGAMPTALGPNGTKVTAQGGLIPAFYQSYNDPKLTALVDRALSYNYDLTTAYLNLRQAEVVLGLAKSNMHPTVSASVSSSASRNLEQDTGSNRSASGNLGIAYELDLFGRLAANERASFESFKATAYDYKAMRLTIIQRTCEYYWNYAYAQEALQLAQDQLTASQQRLNLVRVKRDSGAADGLEYDQALVNHRGVEQTVYQRAYELTAAKNALNTLLGWYSDQDVGKDITTLALEHTVCPQIEVPLPATLLSQRPDLMAYEARVRAAYARVDEANANFYPTFNLNAAVGGGASNSLVEFLRDPIGSLGAAITFPFFNYNELSLQKESSLIERDQAKLDFVNGFITAVKEVSDALNDLSYQEQLQLSTQDEYQLTAANLRRYEERYRYGSASLTEVLDASDALRSAQNRLLSSKRDLLNASMMLMIALGGDSFTTPAPNTVPQTGGNNAILSNNAPQSNNASQSNSLMLSNGGPQLNMGPQPQNVSVAAASGSTQPSSQSVSTEVGPSLAPDADTPVTPANPASANAQTLEAQSVYDPMVILEQAKERAKSAVLVEA